MRELAGDLGAEEGLHGVEDVGNMHAQHLGLVAVEVDEELLACRAKRRVDAHQFRALPRLLEERLDGLLRHPRIARAPILDVELEAAGGAQPRNRGRIDGECEAFLKAVELRVQALQHGERQERGVVALLKGLHRGKEDGRIVGELAVDQAVAIHGGDVLHRRICRNYLLDLLGEPADDIEARGVGCLHDDEEVALVLVGDEA